MSAPNEPVTWKKSINTGTTRNQFSSIRRSAVVCYSFLKIWNLLTASKKFYDDMRKVLRVIMNPHCTTQWTQCDITNQTTGAWSYWKLVTFIQREFNQIHHWQFYELAITGEQYGTGLSITINQSYSDGFNLNRISIKPINSIIVSPDGWVFGWQSVWLPLTCPFYIYFV